MSRLMTFLTALITSVLTAAPAFAQSDVAGYGGQGGQVESAVGETGSGGSALPFTGLELGMLVALAVTLALVGYGLRRLTHAGERA